MEVDFELLPKDFREQKTREQKEFLASCENAEDNLRKASPFLNVEIGRVDFGSTKETPKPLVDLQRALNDSMRSRNSEGLPAAIESTKRFLEGLVKSQAPVTQVREVIESIIRIGGHDAALRAYNAHQVDVLDAIDPDVVSYAKIKSFPDSLRKTQEKRERYAKIEEQIALKMKERKRPG